MTWSKTLADDPDLMFQLRVRRGPGDAFDRARTTTQVVAPCCGRIVAADVLIDCRDIPGTIIDAGGVRAPEDHKFLCDGCAHRMYRDPKNDWTKSKLLEARGAPAALVHEHRAREHATALRRADDERGQEHDPAAALDSARAAIARDHVDELLAGVDSIQELNDATG